MPRQSDSDDPLIMAAELATCLAGLRIDNEQFVWHLRHGEQCPGRVDLEEVTVMTWDSGRVKHDGPGPDHCTGRNVVCRERRTVEHSVSVRAERD